MRTLGPTAMEAYRVLKEGNELEEWRLVYDWRGGMKVPSSQVYFGTGPNGEKYEDLKNS